MKNIAITLAALAMFATPSFADTIHTDGPGQNSGPERSSIAQANQTPDRDFGATVTVTRRDSRRNDNVRRSGFVFEPQFVTGGGR